MNYVNTTSTYSPSLPPNSLLSGESQCQASSGPSYGIPSSTPSIVAEMNAQQAVIEGLFSEILALAGKLYPILDKSGNSQIDNGLEPNMDAGVNLHTALLSNNRNLNFLRRKVEEIRATAQI